MGTDMPGTDAVAKPAAARIGGSVLLAAGLMALMATAIGDEGWLFPLSLLGTAAGSVAVLRALFPGGTQFSLGAANAIAVYACLYNVLGHAAFPQVAAWTRPVAFALPVLAFTVACIARRRHIRLPDPDQAARDLGHLPRFARAAALVGLLALLVVAAPAEQLPAGAQGGLLMATMTMVAAIAVAAVGDLVRLLADIADILRAMGERLVPLAAPILTFVSLWALLIVIFGCLYRIADAFSAEALFAGPNGPVRLGFADAMHFSVVTLSSVGYGDFRPTEDGMRVLASVQMLAAQLLLLFGFAEIMRGNPAARDEAATAPPADGPASAAKRDDTGA